jgi:glycosyltransferase involved in cell wall biosynthesis
LIGYVGNLIDIKNVLTLPDIFRLIYSEITDVEFIIIGDGKLGSELEKRIERFGLPCKFTGSILQNEVAAYMQAMDALILPSKREGLGCVLLEARACGTYVVGSDVGGIPEAIGSAGQVFQLDADFISNVSDAIIHKLKEGYDSMGIAEDVKSCTWDFVANKEIKIFEQIIKPY